MLPFACSLFPTVAPCIVHIPSCSDTRRGVYLHRAHRGAPGSWGLLDLPCTRAWSKGTGTAPEAGLGGVSSPGPLGNQFSKDPPIITPVNAHSSTVHSCHGPTAGPQLRCMNGCWLDVCTGVAWCASRRGRCAGCESIHVSMWLDGRGARGVMPCLQWNNCSMYYVHIKSIKCKMPVCVSGRGWGIG